MVTSASQPINLTQCEVEAILPHRGRALLIREGAAVDADRNTGHAILTVTEEDCKDHFPGQPIFPGKESTEAACQLLGLVAARIHDLRGLAVVESVASTFKRSAIPGTRLKLAATVHKVQTGRHGRITICGECLITNEDAKIVACVDHIVLQTISTDRSLSL